MVLQVGPDGAVFDGPAPSGESSVVLALIDGQFHEVLLPRPVVTGGDSSTVEREALRYDALEASPAPTQRASLALTSTEVVGALQEDVVAALLAIAAESAPMPIETVRTSVSPLAAELIPDLADQTELLVLAAPEQVAVLAERHHLELTIPEAAPPPVEEARAVPTVRITESVPTPTDVTAVFIAGVNDLVARPAETVRLEVGLTPYGASVITSTNWTNPTNALGNNTATAATLQAAASGLAGATSNTVSGTLTLGYAASTPDDLAIGSVQLTLEFSQATGGLPLGASSSRSIEYSLDGGSTWTPFHTGNSAQAKTTVSVDLTAAVEGNWSRIDNFRVRYVGTVTSGTGLGATSTASVFRAWLTITAAKDY